MRTMKMFMKYAIDEYENDDPVVKMQERTS